MISIVLMLGVVLLLVLAFTRKRVFVICAFYGCYAVLTIINEEGIPLLGGFKAYRLVYPILLLSIVARIFQDRQFLVRLYRWPLLPYCLILFVLAISSLYSPSISVFSLENTAGLFDRVFVFSLFCMAASQIQVKSDLSVFAAAAGIVSLGLSVWVIWNAAALEFSAYRGGTSVNENYLSAVILAGAAPLAYVLFSTTNLLLKSGILLSLLCVTVASLILASRGMLVAGAISVLFVVRGVGICRNFGRLKIGFMLGATLALLLVVWMLLPGADNTAARLGASDIDTFNGRTIIWSYSLNYFSQSGPLKMLFGNGLASTEYFLTPVLPEFGNLHNTYLLWLMEQGVLGLIIFVVFLYSLWRIVAISSHPHKYIMFGWLVFLLLAGMSGTVSDDHIFWIIVGVIAGASSFRAVSNPHRSPVLAVPGASPTLPAQLA